MNLSFRFALLLSAASGFIALACELVWARVYNFASGSNAQALGMLLGSYLAGLAAGALWSRRWQDAPAGRGHGVRALGRLIIAANAAAFFVVPAVAWLVTRVEWPHTLPLIMTAAAALGLTFPLLCHLAIPPNSASGARLSYIYLANIIGSGLGSLLTGFVLMDWLRLWQLAAVLLALAALVGLLTLRRGGPWQRSDLAAALAALALATSAPWLYGRIYERLQYKHEFSAKPPFTEIIETRHGVITIEDNKVIFGNGVYDGMLDLGPSTGGGLFRPYFLGAVHPAPRQVLMIGMSGGAWTQILAHHPAVQELTVVEIDHGYIQLIGRHPAVASLLRNPKVKFSIDDGRRWLRRHHGRQFDAIVINTTLNWREFSSAMLSREFLGICRDHLRPGGVLLWNCTNSERAFHTGMTVFPYTMTLANNCLASMSPLTVDAARWERVLREYRIDGRLVFDLATEAGRYDLANMLAWVKDPQRRAGALLDRAEMERRFGGAPIITDDNLGHEYKFHLGDLGRLKELLLMRKR